MMKQFVRWFLCMVLLAAAGGVWAQSDAPDPNALMQLGRNSSDASVMVFTNLVGDFFTNPLSFTGGANSLMGTLFLVFNGFVFLFAIIWMAYGIIFKIVSTASTGEVLGSKMSATWMPVRYITGIAGIVPAFGGFSLSQVLLVVVAALGIGVTNLGLSKVLESTANFQGLVKPALSTSHVAVEFVSAAQLLFVGNVCRFELAREESASRGANVPPPAVQTVRDFSMPGTMAGVSIGTNEYTSLCGAVSVHRTGKGRSGTNASGAFRSGAVNYDAISSNNSAAQANVATVDFAGIAVENSYTDGFTPFADAVKAQALAWHTQWVQNKVNGNPTPPIDLQLLESTAKKYAESITVAVNRAGADVKANEGAITNAAIQKMKSMGWMGLGAWYSTFAEVNAALVDVVNSVEVKTKPPESSMSSAVAEAVEVANRQLKVASAARDNGQGSDSRSFWRKLGDALCPDAIRSSTGNCSLGQALMEQGIGAAAKDSGGAGLVNPIIMFKNMGDWLMVAGETIIVYSVEKPEAEIEIDVNGSESESKGGFMSSVVDWTKKKVGGWVFNTAIGLGGAVSKMLPIIGALMFILGALMALYIPLIPFITWMGGIIQYCVVVVEGLVGMPIAALSHMDSEGEGLGQRTEKGYIFLLNVGFRPILMMFGFFAASSLMIVLGTLQYNLFMPAVANAQGNSVTGLASIVGFLVIFFVMNITLIQGLFNMIFLLPDQVLGLIGANTTSPLGKETEGRVHGMFMAGAALTNKAVAPGALLPKDGPGKGGNGNNQISAGDSQKKSTY